MRWLWYLRGQPARGTVDGPAVREVGQVARRGISYRRRRPWTGIRVEEAGGDGSELGNGRWRSPPSVRQLQRRSRRVLDPCRRLVRSHAHGQLLGRRRVGEEQPESDDARREHDDEQTRRRPLRLEQRPSSVRTRPQRRQLVALRRRPCGRDASSSPARRRHRRRGARSLDVAAPCRHGAREGGGERELRRCRRSPLGLTLLQRVMTRSYTGNDGQRAWTTGQGVDRAVDASGSRRRRRGF